MKTWNVGTSTALKAALGALNPGDTVVLQSGTVYTGNFVLRGGKPNPDNLVTTFISSHFAVPGSTPARNTRVTPADADKMAKIVTPNGNAAFDVKSFDNVTFTGIEFYSTSELNAEPGHKPWPINGFCYYLLLIEAASYINVDRCYIHGDDTHDVNHGVGAYDGGTGISSTNVAVQDSTIRDIHCRTADSQAFLGWKSVGPFRLINNFLSASTEDVMFGGVGGYANLLQPNGILIKGNHFWKDPAWEARTSGEKPWQWSIKNNLEFKSGSDVLVDGNVFENAWQGGDQRGSNIVITPRTAGGGENAACNDIVISNNIMKNANVAMHIAGHDSDCHPPACNNPGETKRLKVVNNLILLRDPASAGAVPSMIMGFMLTRAIQNALFQHNTVAGLNNTTPVHGFFFALGVPEMPLDSDIKIFDNVLGNEVTGDAGKRGTAALTAYMPLPTPSEVRFVGNVEYVDPRKPKVAYPPHNKTTDQIAYTDTPSGDYALVSPVWTDTTDGQMAGVNSDKLKPQEMK